MEKSEATFQENGATGNVSVAVGLFQLMRPRQWVKNGFVLAPLVFAGEFFNPGSVINALLSMLLFCLASSATYILNDIQDRERDRRHPIKSRTRPLAAGVVQVNQALILLVILYLFLVAGFIILPRTMLVILCYLILNVAYSFVLKHQPVIDIFTIAIGFVLRVYAGAVSLSVPLSSWMFVTTLCLALYLASIKRRQELMGNNSGGRKVLKNYSVALVDRYAEMSGTGALLFYSLFVITARPEMVITIPFVLYGLFRYWFIVESKEGGESPTDALLSDWQLMLTVLIWVAVCLGVIWKSGG